MQPIPVSGTIWEANGSCRELCDTFQRTNDRKSNTERKQGEKQVIWNYFQLTKKPSTLSWRQTLWKWNECCCENSLRRSFSFWYNNVSMRSACKYYVNNCVLPLKELEISVWLDYFLWEDQFSKRNRLFNLMQKLKVSFVQLQRSQSISTTRIVSN